VRRFSTLLALLIGLLAARGLGPEGLDSWRAWVVFKLFVRAAAETPDPGISVQISRGSDSTQVTLYLVRQVVETEKDWLHPVGGVVCELSFDDPPATAGNFEAWSFDSGTLDRFVDLVESHPGFADLMGRRPTRSAVYWEEA
jgi:hypothetical protein